MSMKSGKKERRGANKETSPSTLAYKGPSLPIGSVRQVKLQSILVHDSGQFVSSSGGVISGTVVWSNPSGAPTWTNLSSIFDEYRVLACIVRYVPYNGFNKLVATQTCVPLFIALDRDSTATPGTVSIMESYGSCTILDMERSWKFDLFRMSGVRESAFQTTASPVNLGAYVFYGSGFTGSATYGTYLVSYLVQFRGLA